MSNDGKLLMWSERIGLNPMHSPWGSYVLKLAGFVAGDDGPRLENERVIQPEPRYYEGHSFTSGDKRIYFSSNLNGTNWGNDVYVCDIDGGNTINLTNEPKQWEEFGQISPGGRKVSFSSSRAYPYNSEGNTIAFAETFAKMRLELFMMDPDGANVLQISDFNKDEPERWLVSDQAWSPDGSQMVVYVGSLDPKRQRDVVVTLNGSY